MPGEYVQLECQECSRPMVARKSAGRKYCDTCRDIVSTRQRKRNRERERAKSERHKLGIVLPMCTRGSCAGPGYQPRATLAFPPSDAMPGTPEKIAALRWRAENGLPLWHPLDRTDYSDLAVSLIPDPCSFQEECFDGEESQT